VVGVNDDNAPWCTELSTALISRATATETTSSCRIRAVSFCIAGRTAPDRGSRSDRPRYELTSTPTFAWTHDLDFQSTIPFLLSILVFFKFHTFY